MATPLFSKLMTIVIDGSTVGCATDFALSVNKDTIEVACLGSTGAKTVVPDMYGWSVTGSGLVIRTATETSGSYDVFDIATKLLASDASVAISLLPDVSANQYFSGGGYFTSLSYEGGVGAAVTYSFEITGDGVLSVLTTA